MFIISRFRNFDMISLWNREWFALFVISLQVAFLISSNFFSVDSSWKHHLSNETLFESFVKNLWAYLGYTLLQRFLWRRVVALRIMSNLFRHPKTRLWLSNKPSHVKIFEDLDTFWRTWKSISLKWIVLK